MVDRSHGYDRIAQAHALNRRAHIGRAEVRAWAASLSPGADVLDVACGVGEPITQAVIDAGCRVHAIDASPEMIAAFARRFPDVPAVCEPVEQSAFFGRRFDGIVAWGLMFLLPEATQLSVIDRLAQTLAPGGSLLFTAPVQVCTWRDNLTDLESVSLGGQRYRDALRDAGLEVVGEFEDEGDNHYYVARRPQ